jgi:hypothetical protein
MRRFAAGMVVCLGVLLIAAASAAAAFNPDILVSNGSPPTPFSQNKQNEPTVAVDANHPSVLVSGSNDEIDMEACNAGDDTTCPFTQGIGSSGVYFSFDSGSTWTQPTYTGLSTHNLSCQGVVGPDPGCTPAPGPIGTLPWYYEHGLVSDGDPAVAVGPVPGPHGFSWGNGSRLYYANLVSNVASTRTDQAFKGFEAIGVSRTDHMQAAALGGVDGKGDKNAWCTGAAGCAPVLVSKQNSATFSDKEQIWADNAASSPFFGTAYICWANFKGQEKGNAAPAPLTVAVSHDGGDTWTVRPITPSADNSQRTPMDGCTIRTDSHGTAYVFGIATTPQSGKQAFEFMSRSTDGGSGWSTPQPVVGPVTQPGVVDPVQGRPVIDGVAGARSDLAPAPSVDIANGAPTGFDATDRMVMSYVSGTITAPHVYFTESTNHGVTWSAPLPIESPGDRGLFAAPSISPNGKDVYVVYNAFRTPYRPNTTEPRILVGVVTHASVIPGTPTGALFTELHRSPPGLGDPRGSSANALTDEFLGDYVYSAATRSYGTAVWNDTRNAADCPAIDAWRAGLQAGNTTATPPAPQQDCPPNLGTYFGNSDIYGGTYPAPTTP